MAKRKMNNKSFQDSWETDYLFTNIKDRPVCLVCGANVTITKEYNIRRHCETKHYEYKGPGRKAEAAKGAGDEKKSGFPANYVHESKIKK